MEHIYDHKNLLYLPRLDAEVAIFKFKIAQFTGKSSN